MRTFLFLSLAWPMLHGTPGFAARPYPLCVQYLILADGRAEDHRARLESIRDEYAELGRLLRLAEKNATHGRGRLTRAAGEHNLDKYKAQQSVWRRIRLALAALPFLFQYHDVVKAMRWAAERELPDDGDLDELKSDVKPGGISKLRDELAGIERAEKSFARMAERAEQLSRDAAARLLEPPPPPEME